MLKSPGVESAIIFICALLAAAPASMGNTLRVPADYAGIQGAIDAAVAGDEVVISPGTYYTTSSVPLDFHGKAITVRSTNPDDAAVVAGTVIDGTSSTRTIFSFTTGEGPTSVLAGVTLRGTTYFSSTHPYTLYCGNASPRIDRCVINVTTTGSSAFAVGLENSAAVFTGCTLKSLSGAFTVNGGSPTIDRCIITGSSIGQYIGAAIENYSGNVLVRNSFLSLNKGAAIGYSWALHAKSRGTITLQGCTLAKNGMLVAESYSRLSLSNTIVVPAGDSNKIIVNSYSTCDVSYCAITGLSSGVTTDITGTLHWGAGNIDPGTTTPLGLNGYIKPGSMFMNVGDAAYVPQPGEKDFFGNPRVAGGRVDIGCCEVPATAVITAPAAGEVIASGSQRTIRWTSGAQATDLYYSTDGGTAWTGIATGQPGTGTFKWTTPAADSDTCLVAVDDASSGGAIRSVSGQFAIRPFAAGEQSTSPWNSLGGANGRRGLSVFAGPETGCRKLALPLETRPYGGVVVGADGTVYGISEGGFFRFLGDEPHVSLMQKNLPGTVTGSPSMGPDGTIYVGLEDGRLLALDGDGNTKWTFTTGGMITAAPAFGADGRLFVGSGDGSVYALGSDGSELWQFVAVTGTSISRSFFASPTVGADGSVYVADVYKPVLYALNPDTGAVVWQADFTLERASGSNPVVLGRLVAAPAVGPDGTLYLMFEGLPKLYARKTDGTAKWSLNMSDTTSGMYETIGTSAIPSVSASAWSEPVVGPDGTIYVNTDDPYVRAINANGTLKWVRRCGTQGGFTLTVGADGLIYACGDDKSMYVIRPDGTLASVFNGVGRLSYPVVGADGRVYVSDSDGILWTIGDDCTGQTLVLRRMWDADGSGVVDFRDFAMMAADWAKSASPYYMPGDVNRDGYVNSKDMMVIAMMWLSQE